MKKALKYSYSLKQKNSRKRIRENKPAPFDGYHFFVFITKIFYIEGLLSWYNTHNSYCEEFMEMAAYVDFNFQRGFLLDEENLRKIHEILSKRIQDQDAIIKYHIYREDSFSYKTADINEIVKEENKNGNKITEMIVSVSKTNEDDNFFFLLRFSKKGANLKIEDDDRDFVYLLSSDIKYHYKNSISSSLISSLRILKISPIQITTYLMILLLLYIFTLDIPNRNDTHVQALINSSNLDEKLNYLIIHSSLKKNLTLAHYIPLIVIPFIILIQLSGIASSITKFLLPTNLFLIGKEKELYEKRKRFKNNLLWGGLIAFLIGVASSLFVWKITLPS